jgi:small conductance mechanosensitive channel
MEKGMHENMNKIFEHILFYGLNVFWAALTFFVGKFIARFLAKISERLMNKTAIDKTLRSFARQCIYVVLMIFVVIASLGRLGFQTTSMVAVLGAMGLAIGLSLQGSLANFSAGILIILFKPFRVGDVIEGAGINGIVTEIQLFSTTLNSSDNSLQIIPNSKLMGDNITNYSANKHRRVDMVFAIAYESDIETAKKTLKELALSDVRILKNPEPEVAVFALGENSVEIFFRPWVKSSDYWHVRYAILEKGKVALEKNGITIPLPQRDIHISKKEQ